MIKTKHGKRVCKRCLIREMAEQESVYEMLRQHIERIEPQNRADEALYERRLEGCRSCGRLMSGMCRACGCYVELRAAEINNRCPYNVW